jgi:uncharacterized membrane protein
MSQPHLLSFEEQEQIVNSIRQAEKITSGEIKVHIEKKCPEGNPQVRVQEVFEKLEMHQTRERNGVLLYLAYEDHIFYIFGDKGIYEKTPHDFWESTKEKMKLKFAREEFVEGFCEGIEEASKQLARYFPERHDNPNELSDDISFG